MELFHYQQMQVGCKRIKLQIQRKIWIKKKKKETEENDTSNLNVFIILHELLLYSHFYLPIKEKKALPF